MTTMAKPYTDPTDPTLDVATRRSILLDQQATKANRERDKKEKDQQAAEANRDKDER
jgi:hypothetical protein